MNTTVDNSNQQIIYWKNIAFRHIFGCIHDEVTCIQFLAIDSCLKTIKSLINELINVIDILTPSVQNPTIYTNAIIKLIVLPVLFVFKQFYLFISILIQLYLSPIRFFNCTIFFL